MATMPGENSQGNQVWNPSVGTYFRPGANNRESYGGIVAVLNDTFASQGLENKAYPHNFAGIIAALSDLTFAQKQIPVKPGVQPPGGNVVGPDADGNYEWVWGVRPDDGELWYDTNQGRLFVAMDGDYYQTNGADGLAQVTSTSNPPGGPVVGQFWWDSSTRSLYIFDGYWIDEDGDTQNFRPPNGTPLWRLLVDLDNEGEAATRQTTGTLPLSNSILPSALAGSSLPPSGELHVQSDYNTWVLSALSSLDTAITDTGEGARVDVGTTPPTTPSQGDLWYDTVGLELSVWYEDLNTGQWVPTAAIYNYDLEISTLNGKISQEKNARYQDIATVNAAIQSIKDTDVESLRVLEEKITELESHVNDHPTIDLTNYVTTGQLASGITGLQNNVDLVNLTLSSAEEKPGMTEFTTLTNYVNSLPTIGGVATLIDSSKQDLTSFVTQGDINTSINNITTQYLPVTGGTLKGAFKVEKTSPDISAFDFSKEKWHSKNTHKYRSNSVDAAYATFGTTDNFWEYAWKFNNNEDFCWVHNGTDKVFSITKDGPACSQLYIGDIQENTNDGRQIFNKIDVKDRLTKYQSAFIALRQGVANATDFDELKANILLSLNSI